MVIETETETIATTVLVTFVASSPFLITLVSLVYTPPTGSIYFKCLVYQILKAGDSLAILNDMDNG